MATDLKFKTRALVSVGAEGVVLNSNLTQTAAISQESTFNTAFKGVTGSDLTRLYVQTTSDGTVVGFNGEGIHVDVQDGIALHCPDELSASIGKQNAFMSAISGITGYPVSEVGLDTEAEPEAEPEA